MRNCPDCNTQLEDRALFCDNCGLRLSPISAGMDHRAAPAAPAGTASPFSAAPAAPPSPPVGAESVHPAAPGTCSVCGSPNVPGEMFCQNCGVQLPPVASSPPPAPVAAHAPAPVPQNSEVEYAASASVIPTPAPESHPAVPGTASGVPGGGPAQRSCPNCGAANPIQERYCQNCGLQIETPPAVPPASAAPVIPPAYAASASVIPPAPIPASPPPTNAPASTPESTPPALETPPPPPTNAPALAADRFGTAPLIEPGAQSTPSITGKLIVRSTKASLDLPSAKTEITIGRSDPVRGIFPDVDLTPHGGDTGGVSRLHARLILQDGQLHIEDLNSTNYSYLNRQKLQAGQHYPLKSSDEIRLGLVILEYVTV